MNKILYTACFASLLGAQFAIAAPATLPISEINEGSTNWTSIQVDSEGLHISDASVRDQLDNSLGSDAYDDALGTTINGVVYEPSDAVDLSEVTVNSEVIGTKITAEQLVIDGLQVSQSFLFYREQLNGSPTVRALYSITNLASTARQVEVRVLGDLGSDDETTIGGSSSGDNLFDKNDIWAITSDDDDRDGEYSDPAVTHIIQGPDCIRATVTDASISGENFRYDYSVMVPAGQTRHIAVFNQLRSNEDVIQDAITSAETFESLTAIAEAKLFDDLNSQEKSELANFTTERQCSKVGDRVWYDVNADGIQDTGEPGVPNISVFLKDGSGSTVDTMLTDASGNFMFDNVFSGTYSVQYLIPTVFGATASPKGIGSDSTIDSNLNIADLSSDTFELAADVIDLSRDAGVFIPGLLDTDLDGTPNDFDECPALNPNDANSNGIADCNFLEELEVVVDSLKVAVRKLKKGKKKAATVASEAAALVEQFAATNSNELVVAGGSDITAAITDAQTKTQKAATAARKRAKSFGKRKKQARRAITALLAAVKS